MTGSFFLSFLAVFLLNDFFTDSSAEPIIIQGNTMGTTYRIVYFDPPERRDFSEAVDSLLRVVNKSINTYDPSSEISKFNVDEKGVCLELPYLFEILKKGKKVYHASDGAFDPTVMPLVNAWGFGPAKTESPSASAIDSITKIVGFDKVKFSRKRVMKRRPGVQLDMGGIGQGFGADAIFAFLKSQGIEHMLVELGGEGISLGKNLQKNKPWTIGILNPESTPDHQFFKAYVTLSDNAFTTSGNYFNYKVIDGRKYGHTIDPKTGYPVHHSLLSASVFSRDCTTADAWATAFMVMGTEQAIARSKKLKHIDVLLIYSGEDGTLNTYISPGLQKHVTLE